MEKENLVRPSLLSADFNHLGEEIEEAISLGISHIHYDVMDGNFVENISFGEPVFKSINDKYGNDVIFDVHLMVNNPVKHIKQFASLNCKDICLHYEVLTLGDIPKIQEIRNQYPSLKIGLAFSPETSFDEIKSLLNFFDYVLVMSVVPGKGGQKFIEGSENKIKSLKEYRETFCLNFEIGVDGGINDVTGPICTSCGADYLVAGAYYFKSKDKKSVIESFYK